MILDYIRSLYMYVLHVSRVRMHDKILLKETRNRRAIIFVVVSYKNLGLALVEEKIPEEK